LIKAVVVMHKEDMRADERLSDTAKARVLQELAQEFAPNNLRPASANLEQATADTLRTSERLDVPNVLDV
jgi:hypothetical protein